MYKSTNREIIKCKAIVVVVVITVDQILLFALFGGEELGELGLPLVRTVRPKNAWTYI